MEMSTEPGQRLEALGSNIAPEHPALLWQRHKCLIFQGRKQFSFTLESREGMVQSSLQHQYQLL